MKKYFTLDRWLDILRRAGSQGGGLIPIATLSKLSGLKGYTLRKALLRIEEQGLLKRVTAGIYLNRLGKATPEELAMSIRMPCYISFETALSHYGILSQVPLVLTCATTRKPGRKITPLGEIVFRHLNTARFWGYGEENRILWAEPEKALLDWLYWFSKTQGYFPDMDELDLRELNQRKLQNYALSFPKTIRKRLSSLI